MCGEVCSFVRGGGVDGLGGGDVVFFAHFDLGVDKLRREYSRL